MSGRVIAGIGCRRDCAAEDIVSAFHRACANAGRQADALAAPAFKRGETGLHTAKRQLGLPLILIDEALLVAAQDRCVTCSSRASRAVGVASVAEGCALAVAGTGGRLLLARVTSGAATCALAEERSA